MAENMNSESLLAQIKQLEHGMDDVLPSTNLLDAFTVYYRFFDAIVTDVDLFD